MIIKTRVFDLTSPKYLSLPELARVMGISVIQVYRVKEGKRAINQKFIVGAIRAFPKSRFDDLFYLEAEQGSKVRAKSQKQADYAGSCRR